MKAAWNIALKDWQLAGRTRDVLTSTVFFAGLLMLILAFALGPERLSGAAPGVLWSALALSAAIAAGRAFAAEQEAGALETLTLYPAAHEALYLGKLLGTLAQLLLLALVIVPVAVVMLGLRPMEGAHAAAWPLLALTVLLGLIGFAATSCFYSAITVNLRAREALLPVLAFPVMVPVVLASVRATQLILENGLASEWGAWLQFLALYDLASIVVASLLFPYALEG
ncbi:heme exporter protein CcmB [Deinococcus peraridilitoris]|uniref:ABC-type transport system involved in cytochrome c biogenesis, permease component n=1 Tax=Deinococcus peraridilitoris (strain DSM 19664 / LMG 22246 / CIP 109416 / KR-200) TaxID=937777 RepID=K9ZXP8_DEIPD|nr:heme exporter protein CcmB [Deinococcus peraridilitoris]AFZ66371.1 ABC-type transport system involved in cytochrome c biogenesis, permease component [Deinococcus peraridilitoris DSM 19664]